MKPWWIRLARYGLTQWPSLLLVLLLMCVSVLFTVLRPWPLKLIVDSILQHHPLPRSLLWVSALPGSGTPQGLLAWLAGATLLVFLGGWVARATQSYVQAGASSRMIHALGADLFHHLQRLSLRFHGRRTTGDLVKRITSDSACVRQLTVQVFLPLLTSLVTLTSMLLVLRQLDPSLALAALLVSPLLGLCIWFFARPMTQRTYAQYESQGAVMAHAEQILTATPIIRAFAREDDEDQRFAHSWRRGDRAYRRVVAAEVQFKIATGAVTALGTAAVMALGGWHVLEGKLTIGSLLVFLSYLVSLYSPLETLAYLSSGFASAAAGARRIFEILDADELVRDPPQPQVWPCSPGSTAHIQVDQVTFGYEPGRPVLKELSLEARPGETIALVGATGAGKSTLVSLIPRFFDPWQGSIRLNGVDLRQLRLADLRNHISLVLQDPFILPLTVADNIAYARPQAARTEIIAAAQAANAEEFILQLPQQYDTVVGQRGATLSGGQRQRLAIARALLKDAPLLILDEPTAALDAQTEHLLLEALHRLMQGRTTFIIAHRLSTIRQATRIAVLDSGRIVELGSHAQLLAAGGIYYHLCQLQFAA